MRIGLGIGLTALMAGSAFSPSDLFASSETGGWYDPSDLTSLYQSRTGGSIVSADGQTVGIMLDKRLMGGKTAAAFIAGQPELVTNGGFDADTDWTKALGATISAGKANLPSGGGSVSQAIGASAGVAYWCRYTVDSITGGGSARVSVGGVNGTLRASAGTYTEIIVATGTGNAQVAHIGGAAGSAVVDNFSVKALPGFHMIAPSDAARPLYKTSGGLHWLQPDGVDDWMVPASACNLGETWSHVGGWLSSATLKTAFCVTDNNVKGALISDGSNANWSWRDASDLRAVLVAGTVSAAHVATVEQASASAISGRINATSGTPIVPSDTSATTRGLALFTQNNAGFNAGFTGRFYGGLWIARAFTGTERAALESYFAAKAGVSL